MSIWVTMLKLETLRRNLDTREVEEKTKKLGLYLIST